MVIDDVDPIISKLPLNQDFLLISFGQLPHMIVKMGTFNEKYSKVFSLMRQQCSNKNPGTSLGIR